MYCNKSSTKECPYSGNRINFIKKNSLVPNKLRPNFQKRYVVILMSKWFEILKEDWKERLKRIQEANKWNRSGQGKTVKRGPHTDTKRKRRSEAKGRGTSTTGKRVVCDMCGKTMHVRSANQG